MSKQLAAVYSRIDGVERKWVGGEMARLRGGEMARLRGGEMVKGRGYEVNAEFHAALGLEVTGRGEVASERDGEVVVMMTLEERRKIVGAELSRALNEALAKHQERMRMRDEYMAKLSNQEPEADGGGE